MQDRARLAGGDIEIHSAPGMGTQIKARIPYQPGLKEAPNLKEASATNLPQNGASNGIRVLIVDDHEVAQRGIRDMLEQSDGVIVVDEAGDGEEAVEKIRTLAPDVVLLDIRVPKLDGGETTRRVREFGLGTRIIVLSAYAKDEYIFEGLRAGARGYLLKDVGREDLAHAIRTVHNGGSLLQPVIATRLIEQLDTEEAPRLTKLELEVLRLLALGAYNREIANELSLSVNTVKVHTENINQKLGVHTRTQAVRLATERGLIRI